MSLEDKKNVIILACGGNVAKEPSKITNADLAETLKEGEYNITQSTESSDNNHMVVMGMTEESPIWNGNYEPVEHQRSERYALDSLSQREQIDRDPKVREILTSYIEANPDNIDIKYPISIPDSSLPFIILDTIKKLNPWITDEEAKVEAEKVFERMKAKRVRGGKKRHEAVKYIEKTKRIEVEKAKKDEKWNNN